MNAVVIRQINEEDIAPMARDFQQAGVNRDEAYFHFCFDEVKQGKREVFVALLNGRFVGTGHFLYQSKYPHFAAENVPEINDLVVLPELRKQGIGEKLMIAIEDFAISKKYNRIGLGVGLYKDYGIAQRLYVKRGYVPDGRGVFYNNKEIAPGTMVRLDDELVLYLTKKLS